MALQKTIKVLDNLGIEVELKNPYIKIDSLAGNKNKLNINVGVYIENIKVTQFNYFFVPSLDRTNFIAQAYEYLKTLDEFKDAENV